LDKQLKWLIAALALSWLVLFNTVLVTANNLGTRDNIGYINGGKVFRLQGTMWYHIPGLLELGLAPQNIGGQINLRNNEFAMLDIEFNSVKNIDVDVELQRDAMLLVILDRHKEGTFSAIRLTAFESPDSPFTNALIRYENGRIKQRVDLKELNKSLTAGLHKVKVSLGDNGEITVKVDDRQQTLPFEVHNLRPKLALGCGERNTTIKRWQVTGVDTDGREITWEETFSVLDTLNRRFSAMGLLASLIWLLLLGLPMAKVALESRISPKTLIPQVLIRPIPRLVFGLLCLVPWMPLVLQWILGGLYVVYAWLSLWEAHGGEQNIWRLNSGETKRQTGKTVAVALGFIAIAFALSTARSTLRDSLLEKAPARAKPDTATTQIPRMRPLALGERIEATFDELASSAVQIQFKVTLAEGEILRADLLQSPPPPETDVYQVDRSQDTANSPGDDDEEQRGPGDYELKAASVILSTDPGLPGHLRWLYTDKMRRSPQSGWVLEPGTHTVTITNAGPIVTVAVDGNVVDYRSDLPMVFEPTAMQLLAQSSTVRNVGDIVIAKAPSSYIDSLDQTVTTADVLGFLAGVMLIPGLALLLLTAFTNLSFTRAGLTGAAIRTLRANGLVYIWILWWLSERLGWFDLASHGMELTLGAIAVLMATINMAQFVRANRRAGPKWTTALLAAGLVTFAVSSFEGATTLYPEHRHQFRTYCHHQLTPKHFWVTDPMIRRLNPWFIDMRFKRRNYTADHTGKTRIVVFGGSQTYGWGIPAMDRMTFSDQLERALHADGYKSTEVLNAAFPGVKTATGLRWFSSNLLRYNPDIVVINFVVNEFMNVDPYHVWAGENDPNDTLSSLATVALLKHWRGDIMDSHLFQILVASVYEIYEMDSYLKWWVKTARDRGIKVVFSIEPTNLYVESSGKAIMRQETQLGSAQDTYRRLGKSLNVPVFDVLPHFVKEQENMWFYDTMHMSRLGHRVFAENLAKLIASEFFETPSAKAAP